MTFSAQPAQSLPEPPEGFLLLEPRHCVGAGTDVQQAARHARPTLRLDHPEMSPAQIEHALGDLGDALEEGGADDRAAGPPVGQGAEVVELRARPAEEPQSAAPSGAPDEGVEAVHDDPSGRATARILFSRSVGSARDRPARASRTRSPSPRSARSLAGGTTVVT